MTCSKRFKEERLKKLQLLKNFEKKLKSIKQCDTLSDDEERKKESLILAWELSMHVLGAYKQIPKTPKTPSVENPFLPKKNDKQVCTSLIPNESKRRGHGRTSWRRRTGTLVAVASLRRK